MAERYQPIFKYYPLTTTKMVVEIDPQDTSTWPYHFLVYCELNPTTGQWDLYQNEKVPMSMSEADLNSAVREACFQLVKRLNEQIEA